MEETMNFETEFLKFIERKPKPKTRVFSVMTKDESCELGEISWYPAWRHYCFFPTVESETVHSYRCLMQISNFVKRLNDEHKARS